MTDWSPIETAPLPLADGGADIHVLMWSADDGCFVGYAWVIRGERHYSDYPGCIEGNIVQPTHWMALPDEPSDG